MELTPEQIVQFAVALLLSLALLVAAYSTPMRASVAALLLLVPFQIVDTKYGSSNVVMAYVLLAGLLMSGRRLEFPMLGHILLIFLAYLVSMSQVDTSVYGQNAIYLFTLLSGFVVFVLAYNFAREIPDVKFIVNILIIINVMVAIYCLAQLVAGPGARTTLFGINELTMYRNRGGTDARLVGPFGGSPGITAEYLMMMILLLAFDLIYSTRRRKFWLVVLIALNMGLIIATGNRGGFLTLIASYPLFLFLFRRDLGTARVLRFSVAGVAVLALMAVVTVVYTDFGRLFERLQDTAELENGVPATRAGTWPIAWAGIEKEPWVGHGPRLRLLDDYTTPYPGHEVIPYPHSLYLFLLYTVGIVGAIAVLSFLIRIMIALVRGASRASGTPYYTGLVRLGPLLLMVFLIDQIKIEFLREGFVDYFQYVFAVLGIWLGLSDRDKPVAVAEQAAPGGELALRR